jgi:hypothetical protein
MKDEFNSLLKSRFVESNNDLLRGFTKEKQNANERGMLISAGTVEAMHAVLAAELINARETIVKTAFDAVNISGEFVRKDKIQSLCINAFEARIKEIESLYKNNVSHISNGLPNKAMLEPYMSISENAELQVNELKVAILNEYERYLSSRGGNLTNYIKNRFLNNSAVAWVTVVFAAIGAIAIFSKAIEWLIRIFESNG